MLLDVFLQVILLSATMPQEVLDVTTKFMRDPVRILVKKEELTLEGIRQFYINVEREVREHIINFYMDREICLNPVPLLLRRFIFHAYVRLKSAIWWPYVGSLV